MRREKHKFNPKSLGLSSEDELLQSKDFRLWELMTSSVRRNAFLRYLELFRVTILFSICSTVFAVIQVANLMLFKFTESQILGKSDSTKALVMTILPVLSGKSN